MKRQDIPGVVEAHLDAFSGFFLSFLGTSFLRELYRGIADDPSGIAFVVEGGGQVTGFVAGTAEPAGFYARLIRRRAWRFVLASASGVLRRPRIIPRLFRALAMPREAARYNDAALLMSIGVTRGGQGTGAGKALVEAFLDEAARRGVGSVVLTTDREDNEAVNAFYLSAGFECHRSFSTPEGREMNEYEIAVRGRKAGTS